MKNLFKIFKTGVFLTLVVLLTGMISALSTLVFAQEGGGVTQLELSSEIKNDLMNMGMLTPGSDGRPERIDPPPNIDTEIVRLSLHGDSGLGTVDVHPGGRPLSTQEETTGTSILDELLDDSPLPISELFAGSKTNQEGTTGTSIGSIDWSQSPNPLPLRGHWTDGCKHCLLEAMGPFGQSQSGLKLGGMGALFGRLFTNPPGSDPDKITSDVENVLGGGATTAAQAEGTVGQTPDTTPEPTGGGGGCSAGEHYHPGFGCEADH